SVRARGRAYSPVPVPLPPNGGQKTARKWPPLGGARLDQTSKPALEARSAAATGSGSKIGEVRGLPEGAHACHPWPQWPRRECRGRPLVSAGANQCPHAASVGHNETPQGVGFWTPVSLATGRRGVGVRR